MQASSDTVTPPQAVLLPPEVDLHARPAAAFVRTAMGFSSQIWITSGEREVDAKSLLSVLALGARRGTQVHLRAEGEDAAAALEALARTIAELRE